MRKSMLLAALLAMVLVAAAPALAQVVQEFEQEEAESGDAEPEVAVANKGASVNSCTAVLQQTNTGNQQNAQGVVQYSGTVDDVEISGTAITLSPEGAVDCQQLIEQAAAAAKGEAKAGKAEAKAAPAEAKAGKAEAKAEAPKAEAKAGKAEAKKELPKTGGSVGSASLLALGAGALLVAAGLLARRIIR